ncbi:glycoside hydrolase family 3 C-terminal domain-containing protein [Paenibacillus endoradicis]|uniref:glycoside hydrolase family 3 C-terminal domain-containing protein n=1 Tax=Paenibacillus endoradicis TaxID=2972487 RepID=UPI0021593329|nr:glycoside hydrolase family 3 C-terminal domain-containing protein [Paenibacillus endoradicis]MCR8657020.1 glycoside hydrolase family 3 C-terminal domain-containing protein [Paenibacillus endoradicis]
MRQLFQSKASKRVISIALTCTLSISVLGGSMPSVAQAAEGDAIIFKTQSGGVFNGMPLFDGVPEHLDEFVDTYFDYTGLEGPAVYASGSRNHYILKEGPNAGNKIPGALSAADNVQGVSTDFPALVGMGQTWNKELLSKIGSVMGSEKISQLQVKQGNSNIHGGANASASVAFTVVSDMRINPLSGRFDEGFSEDAFMAAELIDSMASGLSGVDQVESDDGFWMRAAVGTKHFSVYNAQWYRFGTSTIASPRAIFEYQTLSPIKALASGSVAGVMTSYGMTNGVPNIISPYQRYANEQSRFGVYSSPDFNGDQHTFNTSMSNGYDTSYTQDRTLANILMALAKSNAGRPSPSEASGNEDVAALVAAVREGAYGITEDDLIEAARPHVNQLVRLGIFNETDENGIPKFYPFAQDALDVRSEAPATYALPEHQDVALMAAQESIVLLKNDGILPLLKDQKVAVSGMYADARFKTTYSVGTTPDIPNSGDSPLLSIIKQVGADNVTYDLGGKIIALTSKENGEIVTADLSANVEQGSQLITTSDPLDLTKDAQLFRVIDLGQGGINLLSLANDRFVTSPTGNASNVDNLKVGNTDATPLNLTNNDWNLAEMSGSTSTIPPRLRIESNDDNTVSFVTNGYRSGFSGEFADWYYSNGRIVTTVDHKLTVPSTPLGNTADAADRSDAVKFEKTVVKEVGEDAVERATIDDYAIVFVGAIPRHSAGEGNDRSSLYMGNDDYELVDKVSTAFAAEGKKTIVVVKSSFPVVMEDIQNNPNVSAIVYQPYGGQYDSYALAQVLYGDYAPTGRLSSTWYADMSAFDAISDYSIPESFPSHQLGVNIDPRYTVDMTNADPIESKLTYMYTTAPVTYEFGYGLSYSDFNYSNLKAPATVSDNELATVSVDVSNNGTVDTSEVVQLYVSNEQSSYGESAPSKKLVAFEKVEIAAGETKTVVLTVDPQDFAIWDVNKGDFIVESGTYSLMVGASSNDIRLSKDAVITGSAVAILDAYRTLNVFDHSFASDNVKYYEVSKERTAINLKNKKTVGGYYAVGSKSTDSWTALPKVDLTDVKQVTASVASDANGGIITLHAGSPDNEPLAILDVPETEPVTYTIENAGVPVTELGYTDVTVDLSNTSVTGVHDLYVVFKAADLRMDSLSFQTSASISTSSQLKSGQLNPQVVVQSARVPFGTEATDLNSWLLDEKTSGLALESVSVNESGLQATVQFSGASRSGGTISLTAKAAAFDGNVSDSNTLSLTIKANGGGTPITNPEVTPTPTKKPEPESPLSAWPVAQVRAATSAEQELLSSMNLPGVVIAGNAVVITTEDTLEGYALAEIMVSNANSTGITAFARLNADGTLTPVPNKITNSNGQTHIDALVSTTGIYVPISVSRSFIDVPANAWYAQYISQVSSMLIMNGVSSKAMKPLDKTTTAHTLMVALNVLGLTPEKAANDQKWYNAVLRTAAKNDLMVSSSSNAEATISRQGVAEILMQVLDFAEIEPELSLFEIAELLKGFSDMQNVSEEDRKAMAIMVKYGIFNGKTSNKLAPMDEITRAELATVALRTRQVIDKQITK